MIPYRKPPENIIIETKVVKGNTIYGWNGKWYITEYLARKSAQKSYAIIEKSIKRTYV